MKNKYMFLFLIGVILLIVGLYFSFKEPGVREGLVDTSLIVLGGLGSVSGTNSVYYADTGLTNSPNWQASSGSTYKQISGSNGFMVAVDTGNNVWLGSLFDTSGLNSNFTYTWKQIANGLQYVSFDFPMLVGINTSGAIVYIDHILSSPNIMTPTAVTGTLAQKTFKQICSRLGNAYAVGTDNKIWYAANVRNPIWIECNQPSTIVNPAQVAYDGSVAAANDTAGNVYYTKQTGILTQWISLPSKKLKQISLANGIAVGIGLSDNLVYMALNIGDNSWISLTTPNIVMSQVEAFYPSDANVRTQRNTSIISDTCSEPGYGEKGIDGLCYEPCPPGYTSNLGACTGIPKMRIRAAAAVIPPLIATCGSGYDVIINGTAKCVPIVDDYFMDDTQIALSEVYGITGSFNQAAAAAKCVTYGGVLASAAQLKAASTAGASWTSQGWLASNLTSSTTGLVQAPTGGDTPTSATLDITAKSGAICYGVKPFKEQFSDILPFNSSKWNQTPPCANGYKINFPTTCYVSCNPDSYTALNTLCIGKEITKKSSGTSSTQPLCAAGFSYDIATSKCVQNCATGFVPDSTGENCVSEDIKRVVSFPSSYWALTSVKPDAGFCDQNEDLIDGMCVKKCGIDEVSSILRPRLCRKACSSLEVDNGDNTCSSICPSNTTAINNTTCRPKVFTSYGRFILDAPDNYCPTGTSRGIDGKCYPNGCIGLTFPGTSIKTTDKDVLIDNVSYCKLKDLVRPTTNIPSYNPSTTVPCDTSKSEYIPSTYECLSLCADKEITSDTKCVPPMIVRTGKSVSINCNGNEEIVNGICVSKCPTGTYAKGSLCVKEKTVVAMIAGITKCISTPYGKYKKWLCDKSSDSCLATCEAAKLLKDPTNDTTYVDPADQICVSDDPTTKMYYCQSGAEAKLNGPNAEETRSSYSVTCDTLSKNYTDLSGALNSIATIKDNMIYGKYTIGDARDSLDRVYNNLKCSSSSVDTICKKILEGRNAIGGNYDAVNRALDSVATSIQQSLDSRGVLRTQLYNLKCPNYTKPPSSVSSLPTPPPPPPPPARAYGRASV